jgi:RHH-type proline utilization regulon transcriptional repressor/proline dehydrogenase/delta 1-pyrroline-5-carboxylate dehydrogenase
LNGIEQLEREIFGPVLHVVRYKASQLEALVEEINARNFGLTLGIHTRVDNRVQMICERARVGNTYVNRNQIGAAVGSQPFGGEGLSGTGPKAGGPHYLHRFVMYSDAQPPLQSPQPERLENTAGGDEFNQRLDAAAQLQPAWSQHLQRSQVLRKALVHCTLEVAGVVQQVLDSLPEFTPVPVDLPGPTGESNRYSVHGRGVFLCASGGLAGIALTSAALLAGNAVVLEDCDAADSAQKDFVQALIQSGLEPGLIQFNPGRVSLEGIRQAKTLAGVLHQLGAPGEREIRQALADRKGPIGSIISDASDYTALCIERSLCIDTTASGGNAQLLASAGGPA